MKKLSINLAKLFLTLLLILNIAVIDSPVTNDENSIQNQSEIQKSLLLPSFYLKEAHYDQNGKFTGCYGNGNDCIVIPLASSTITLSAGGINTQ